MDMNLIPSLDVSSSALTAERKRLDVVASNLANAQTTRGVDGKPYRRKEVIFEAMLAGAVEGNGRPGEVGVKVAKVVDDQSALPRVYNPSHPHADKDGMVTMPNVNMVKEVVDMMTASRSYEANVKVLQAARQMAIRTMEIGR